MQANFTDNSFLKIISCDLDEVDILKKLSIEEI